MTATQLPELLGLPVDATAETIEEALRSRRAGLLERQAANLPDSLRSKYRAELESLNGAESTWRAASAPAPNMPLAGLSLTQAADLPGAAPQLTRADLAGARGLHVGLAPGSVLAERYEVTEVLGAGGMGAVYAAFDRVRGEEIALKALLPALLANETARERFQHEATLSSKLSHPSIVNVFDVQRDGAHHFLTMERLAGATLRQRMDERKTLGDPFGVEEALDLLEPVLDALAYAHTQGAVHRDVKPENVFLCGHPSAPTVKLLDFGIARVLSTSQMTATGAALGTAYYMAPEQLTAAATDGRADLYSVGVVLYELLTGQLPTGRFKSVGEVRPEVSLVLSEVIDRALEGDPEARHADVTALRDALRDACQAKPRRVRARSGGIRVLAKLGAAAAGLVLVAGAGVLAVGSVFSGDPQAVLRADAAHDAAEEAREAALALEGEDSTDAMRDARARFDAALVALEEGLHEVALQEFQASRLAFEQIAGSHEARWTSRLAELRGLLDVKVKSVARCRARAERADDQPRLRELTRAVDPGGLSVESARLEAQELERRGELVAASEAYAAAIEAASDWAQRFEWVEQFVESGVEAELDEVRAAWRVALEGLGDPTLPTSNAAIEAALEAADAPESIGAETLSTWRTAVEDYQRHAALLERSSALRARANEGAERSRDLRCSDAWVALVDEQQAHLAAAIRTLDYAGIQEHGADLERGLEAGTSLLNLVQRCGDAHAEWGTAMSWFVDEQLLDEVPADDPRIRADVDAALEHVPTDLAQCTQGLEMAVERYHDGVARLRSVQAVLDRLLEVDDETAWELISAELDDDYGRGKDAVRELRYADAADTFSVFPEVIDELGLLAGAIDEVSTRRDDWEIELAWLSNQFGATLPPPPHRTLGKRLEEVLAARTRETCGETTELVQEVARAYTAETAVLQDISRVNGVEQAAIEAAKFDRPGMGFISEFREAGRELLEQQRFDELLAAYPKHLEDLVAWRRTWQPELDDLGHAFRSSGPRIEFVRIEPGEFDFCPTRVPRDWPRKENRRTHRIRIAQPFYMGKFEVTGAQYRAFVNETGYEAKVERVGKAWALNQYGHMEEIAGASWRNGNGYYGSRKPVTCMEWKDAVAFTRWLNEKLDRAGQLPAGYEVRLPTSAEWEYGCRAGTTTDYNFGASFSSARANVGSAETVNVGSYTPNAWGLYDMHGNVEEICLDGLYDMVGGEEFYRGLSMRTAEDGPLVDPYHQRDVIARGAVVRGGSWYENETTDEASAARSNYVGCERSDLPMNTTGFRVVLAPVLEH